MTKRMMTKQRVRSWTMMEHHSCNCPQNYNMERNCKSCCHRTRMRTHVEQNTRKRKTKTRKSFAKIAKTVPPHNC